jgi:hypothetical protein
VKDKIRLMSIPDGKSKIPINGGVEKATGDLVLMLRDDVGEITRICVPFDQSGTLQAMFERAVNNASKHCKNQRPDLEGAVWSTSLYPWEVEEIILGEDRTGDRFTMTIKIAGDS